jgi:hypothetical protein
MNCNWCSKNSKIVVPLLGCTVCIDCAYVYEFVAAENKAKAILVSAEDQTEVKLTELAVDR